MLSILADPTFLLIRADEWEAIGVWFSGLTTIGLLIYAGRQLKQTRDIKDEQSREARELLDEQTRPYVIVDFHFRSIMISLSVKNIGKTPAADVRVVLDQRIESAVMPSVAWQDSPLFTDGGAMFAPGREMQFPVDTYPARLERGLPMSITGRVEYSRFDGRGERLVESFRIDMAGFSQSLLPPKDIADVGDELEKVRKLIDQRLPKPGTAGR